MPLSQRDERIEHLLEARERLAVRRAQSAAELESMVRDLAELIHSVDRIRRCVTWSAETIERIAERQDYSCPQCRKRLPPLSAGMHHVDHVVPWILGGGNELTNIQILHDGCNLTKGRRCDFDSVIEYLDGRVRNI